MIHIPANRVAVIATWLTGLVAFIGGVVQTLPNKWQDYALAASGLLTQLVTVLKFLSGAQKWDAITNGTEAPPNTAIVPVEK